jgi:thiosulfate/3-mercaptopyruvate sulfurtransferase
MNPLVTASELTKKITAGVDLLIFDCRFDLTHPSAGIESYSAGHIPGAIYVDLEKDLSSIKTGTNGRHPLPSPVNWGKTRQRLGIAPNQHVIAYDNQGAMFASRLWWMLRAIGHEKVQVLDGGLDSWKGQISTELLKPVPLEQPLEPFDYNGLVLVDEVLNNVTSRHKKVLDARASDRFHGQNETLDPVGGHIPGALNRFFKDNLDAGLFKTPEKLRQQFSELLGNISASDIIHQCGSGVTACHNLLAMESAGLSGSRLYAGSWSEWCADPKRPVEI